MTPQSAQSFATWLMKDQPELFLALAERAGVQVNRQNMGGFSDILSAIGSGVSNAVKSVGSFLTSSQGLTTLTSLGTAYLTTAAQKNAVNIQLEQAKANAAAAPIQTTYNPNSGAYEVVYTNQNGQQVPVTAQNKNQLLNYGSTSILSQPWFPYAAIAGVGILAYLIFRGR